MFKIPHSTCVTMSYKVLKCLTMSYLSHNVLLVSPCLTMSYKVLKCPTYHTSFSCIILSNLSNPNFDIEKKTLSFMSKLSYLYYLSCLSFLREIVRTQEQKKKDRKKIQTQKDTKRKLYSINIFDRLPLF